MSDKDGSAVEDGGTSAVFVQSLSAEGLHHASGLQGLFGPTPKFRAVVLLGANSQFTWTTKSQQSYDPKWTETYLFRPSKALDEVGQLFRVQVGRPCVSVPLKTAVTGWLERADLEWF